jgi:hypothetical protein
MSRIGTVALGFIVTLAVAWAPAAAQQLQPSRGGVLIAPRAGWVMSLGSLGRVAEIGSLSTGTAHAASSRVSLGSGATVGTAALFDVPDLPILWRIDLDHAPSLGVDMSGQRSDIHADATFATAGVVTRTGLSRVEPFGQAGIGFRAVSFRAATPEGTALPDGRVDLLARLGGGLALRLGFLDITAEMAALTSSFRFDDMQGGGDRKLQVDLAGMLGLRMRVF